MFLNPLGLLALLSVVPLIILYIIKPDPRRLEIPTLDFLPNFQEEGGSNPVIERLRRNLLLLIQLLVLILISLSLAGPFVEVSRSAQVDNTVIVLDASASMATETGGGTRFSQAVSDARGEITTTTSVIVSDWSARSLLAGGSAGEARGVLDGVTVSDAEGDLRSAISQAISLAEGDGRIVVLSDFADQTDWMSAVQSARAQDIPVALRQYEGGGEENVGIVSMSFASNSVTVGVRNYGDDSVTREVSFGGQSQSLELEAGDIGSASFRIPAGGGEVRLSPGDSFPTDDTAYVVGHPESTIQVLMVTNDRNDFLHTAFTTMPDVDVDVGEPPVGSFGDPDVVVFSNVDQDRLLGRTVRDAQDHVAGGGGVVIQAQPDLGDMEGTYDELLIADVGEPTTGGSPQKVAEDEITRGIDFSPPQEYLEGSLSGGRALVNMSDGSPLVAVGRVGDGAAMYYGYIEQSSEFKYNYLYPVFWKRALYYLTGRERLSSMNRQTGETLSFASTTTIDTPGGTATGSTLVMREAGFYSTGSRRVSANLVSAAESDVAAESIEESGASAGAGETRSETVPQELTPLVALLALGFVGGELLFLRYRGDI